MRQQFINSSIVIMRKREKSTANIILNGDMLEAFL